MSRRSVLPRHSLRGGEENSRDQSGIRCDRLIVEQKVREILKIAHRVIVLRTERISFDGPATELSNDAKLKEVFL